MIDNLKKYWFVVVICLVLIVGTVLFAKQQMGTVLRGKTVEGKQVVSEIAGINYFGDDYQQDLKDRYGDAELYKLFERSVLGSIETPEEVVTKAKEDAATVKTNVSAQQGQAGLDTLNSQIVALGYKGLDELNLVYEDMAKRDTLVLDLIASNKDLYLKPYVDAKSPRVVSHILVKMTDPKNPTAEEQKKIDDVNARLAEGTAFSEVAMALSDDTGSAQKGGSIGFMDKDSQLVTEFLTAAIATEEGQMTEWVESEYGRHLIKVDSTNTDTFMTDENYKGDFISAISSFDSSVIYQAIWNTAQTLEVSFKDEAVKKSLMEYMNIKEGQ
ncbi:peptidylprolyl isomerase [Erysipelothrix sp. HDW6C]|uniref:peptidylprolyl isomerase n=1 Tax=Erysipelothrix sp. HDW6C TaxID=2714930 RepID=UPI00140E2A3A|nr:peptidylprolyl isomerase [Erysipelothrix sp. HDW6C]QIK70430.1 peptidylprolyl isomerase [Erysipelothrix sp. HDW6C]